MSKIERDFRFIHYWKGEISNDELQGWIDKMMLYDKQYFLILLDEKLTRAEQERAII